MHTGSHRLNSRKNEDFQSVQNNLMQHWQKKKKKKKKKAKLANEIICRIMPITLGWT